MPPNKQRNTKTQILKNDDLEKDVINPIITAGVKGEDQNVVLTDAELKKLGIRKKLELNLVKKFDKTTIKPQECWYLMDSEWLNKWSAFVMSTDDNTTDMPGPVSSKGLLSMEGALLPNLQTRIDYRGVPPIVFYIFVKLYGKDNSVELPRFTLDIYAPQVDVGFLAKVQNSAQREAIYQVNKIRPQWVNWEVEYSDDEEDDAICCWGFITKEHIESIIYWAVRCWTSRSKNRGTIKYSQYKPLKGNKNKDDDDDNDDRDYDGGSSTHGSLQREHDYDNSHHIERNHSQFAMIRSYFFGGSSSNS